MGLMKINIFLRDKTCHLLQGVWRTDLVVQYANSGLYLVNHYPELIAQLQARYPGWSITVNPAYMGADRIKFVPPAGTHINELELDVPPGAYKLWTRCCFLGNEESNAVMTSGCSGDHKCVQLIVDADNVCGRHMIQPAIERVVNDMDMVDEHKIAFARGLLHFAVLSKAELQAHFANRLAEATALGDTTRIARVNAAIALVAQVVECC